jgi:hypothetical protein
VFGQAVRRAAGAIVLVLASQAAALAQDAPPATLTAEEDHARLMGMLGIEGLRPGRNGSDPASPNYANYDEAKSNPYPDLPDPLVMNDGRPVTSAEMWRNERRPEIVEAFDREIYGRTPTETPAVAWAVVSEVEETVGEIPVVTRSLVGHVDNAAYPAVSVDIELVLTLPADAAAPAPAILRFGLRFPPGLTPPAPPAGAPPAGPSAREQVLARGWAYAEVFPTTVQADNGAGLTSGIIGLVNKGQPRDVDDWGVLKAWAWGASRALDYFETVPEIDAGRVALEGLSRYGKATLVAMAYDERFAIGFPGSSGEGGASLFRRDNGEIVENLAGTGEYHWMAGNFLKYAGPLGWDDLPVDAHALIALAAPRPLLIGSGTAEAGDAWVDPRGMFMAAAAASPVYDLLGADGLPTDEMPPVGVGLTDGALAWRQHAGGHTSGPNWGAYLAFAARYLDAGPSR